MDSLAVRYDSITGDTLSEHILVMANAWLVDTLAATQYETFADRDSFVYDQRELIIIRKGTRLYIPNLREVSGIQERYQNSRVELNIPECRLRVICGQDTLLNAPCRVGRNEYKFLGLAGNTVWLKTDTGRGYISRIEKDPLFLNPVTGEKFTMTRRDDRQLTMMPLIPWIEPTLNGTVFGDLIHATTNPATLGKPISNGCVGLSEADTWRFYYLAPIGTKVHFYYRTRVVTVTGDTLFFPDIYAPELAVFPETPPATF